MRIGIVADIHDAIGPLRTALGLLHDRGVDRIVTLVERHHSVEDAPMRVAIEVVAVDDLRGEVERVVVNQDGAEDGTFGFEIVRECTFSGGDCSLWHRRGRNRTTVFAFGPATE